MYKILIYLYQISFISFCSPSRRKQYGIYSDESIGAKRNPTDPLLKVSQKRD